MRKIIVSEFVSLDGVIEDPGGSEKTKHGGWTFQFGGGEEQGKYKFEELFASDGLLLGRVTYEGFAAAWPNMQGTGAFGERMNSLPKYVVSTTLSSMTWNAAPIRGNIADEVLKLKQMSGQDILVFGSGKLVHTLHDLNLIDEYRLMVFPVVLGSGKRLFAEGSEMRGFDLCETKPMGSGVLLLTYQPLVK